MKSLTAVCQTGASMPAINPAGRISRHTHPRHAGANSGENAEMKMYLSKLKDLVPFMPKNRKLSKLEIIQHVIDYICDLQTELETHPEINNFDAAAALNFTAALQQQQQQQQPMQSDEDEQAEEDEELEDDETIANMGDDDQDMLLSHRLAADVQQQQQQQQQQKSSLNAQRQPLVDRQAPNTFLPASVNATQHAAPPTAAAAAPATQQQQPQQQQAAPSLQTQTMEKERQSRNSTC